MCVRYKESEEVFDSRDISEIKKEIFSLILAIYMVFFTLNLIHFLSSRVTPTL